MAPVKLTWLESQGVVVRYQCKSGGFGEVVCLSILSLRRSPRACNTEG